MEIRFWASIRLSTRLKPVTAELAVPSASLASVTNSVVRSTSVPTAEALLEPLIVSPSQSVARYDAFVDLRRPEVDRDHVRDLTAAIFAPGTGCARSTGLTQQPDDLGAQLTSRHRVNGRVDGLVTGVAIRVAGMHASK